MGPRMPKEQSPLVNSNAYCFMIQTMGEKNSFFIYLFFGKGKEVALTKWRSTAPVRFLYFKIKFR